MTVDSHHDAQSVRETLDALTDRFPDASAAYFAATLAEIYVPSPPDPAPQRSIAPGIDDEATITVRLRTQGVTR